MRRQLLSDQLGSYESAGAGWSLWTYKDIGVQGLAVVDPDSAWMRRTAAVRAKKAALGADYWGATEEGISDVMEPLLARFEREFPAFDPYPFGRRRYVEQLVRNILFSEQLAEEFAAAFADAGDEELAELGESFAFGRCAEQKPLCELVAAACR
jgi:endoglucanase